MALYVRQDEERSELQQRIAADLREKQKKNERSLILKTPPNIPETLQRSLN